jgi:polyisoprenoid-binding protein YceI
MKPLAPTLLAAAAVMALAACSQPAAPAKAPAPAAPAAPKPGAGLPAGEYRLDPSHASLTFRVDHLGFSHYTARFTTFDAALNLDPANPAAASLTAEVDAGSLQTDNKVPDINFNDTLKGESWLNAAAYPKMTFRSTKLTMTGPDTATVTGDFTLRGITKPVTLQAKFNGGYASNPYDPGGSRIGFSARGELKRSDYGISFGVPAPGTTMGVSDAVEIIIEAEFIRPVDKK